MTKFIVTDNEQKAGIRAAEIMADVIKKRPDALIGLATGSTPINMYSRLVSMYSSGEISFDKVRSVNLDEYVGLSSTDSQSYAFFMWEKLFGHINIRVENTHLPCGTAADPMEECERYNALLNRLGKVDIQLLGLGHNGHIAFNEPSDCFSKDTSLVELTESTKAANSRFFDTQDQVPRKAISMGIGRILSSKAILLLVTGLSKADILEKALFGDVTPTVPASILQFYQGDLTVVCDSDAFSLVKSAHPDIKFTS